MVNPTNIAKAKSDPPTPADRGVPIHGWKTKKGTKEEGRWVVIVVSLGFHRERCLGGGSTKSPMGGK